jgi:hypothetical protein
LRTPVRRSARSRRSSLGSCPRRKSRV